MLLFCIFFRILSSFVCFKIFYQLTYCLQLSPPHWNRTRFLALELPLPRRTALQRTLSLTTTVSCVTAPRVAVKVVRKPALTLNILKHFFKLYVFEFCHISDGVIGKKCTSSKEKHFYKTNLIINKQDIAI